jgi:hypothetical protein
MLSNNIVNENKVINIFNDDLPNWIVGDEWIYEMDAVFFELVSGGSTVTIDAAMKNLVFKVKSIGVSDYDLDVSGDIQGSFYYDDGADVTIGGELSRTELSGNVKIEKTTLALIEANIVINTRIVLNEYPLPINIPIPIPFTISLDVTHDDPRPLIDFPLSDGKSGTISEAYISANLKVESIILKIINIFVPEVPAELTFGLDTYLPGLLYSADLEEITVKAGTFEVYDIGFFEGLFGSIYYAAEVKNIIKIEVDFELPEELKIEFFGEMKSEVTIIKSIR